MGEVWLNRERHEDYAVRWQWDAQSPGLSAIIRARNEARSLPFTLPGVLKSAKHTHLIDNASTDGTAEIARDTAEAERLSERLTITSYPFDVAGCGPDHLMTPPDSVNSLVYYYNYAFSHVDTAHALKWDADMALTYAGERVIRDLSWQLEGAKAAVRLVIPAVYVASDTMAYADFRRPHRELFAWPNSPERTFVKAFDWEMVRAPVETGEDEVIELPPWVCFELKWLEADEFSHWSTEDFKDKANARKRREHELYSTLARGEEPGGRIQRVDSADEHVVEKLRREYPSLRSLAENRRERFRRKRLLEGVSSPQTLRYPQG